MSRLLILTSLVALVISANSAHSAGHLRFFHPGMRMRSSMIKNHWLTKQEKELQDLRFQIQFNQPSEEVVQDPIKNKIYVDMYINHWI